MLMSRAAFTFGFVSMASLTPPAAMPSSFLPPRILLRPPAALSRRSTVPLDVIGPPCRPCPVATGDRPRTGDRQPIFTPDAAVLSAVRICPSSPTARRTEVAPSCPIRSPLVDVGESASKQAVAVCPVPPLAIATVPVTFAAVPETLPVTLPTTSRVADPPALRLTIVEGVLASVAARARAT